MITKQELARMIDHTNLDPTAKEADIKKLCGEAIKHNFFSVCILPYYVKFAKAYLRKKRAKTKVCCVVGYPLGANKTSTKAAEAAQAVRDGADELDMVQNITALKNKKYSEVEADIKAVVKAAKGRPVKVIIETDYLSDAEKVKSCKLAEKAGAAFVKTSTRKVIKGATAADIKLMRRTVPGLGVKASGGIDSLKKALALVKAGATRLGTSHSLNIVR